jgi:hypothetical protein
VPLLTLQEPTRALTPQTLLKILTTARTVNITAMIRSTTKPTDQQTNRPTDQQTNRPSLIKFVEHQQMLVAKFTASTISGMRLGLWKRAITGRFCPPSSGLLDHGLRRASTSNKRGPVRRTNFPSAVFFNKCLSDSCPIIWNWC